MCVTSCNTKEIKYKVLHIFHILLFIVHRYNCINPIQCIFTTHNISITIHYYLWYVNLDRYFHAILPTFTSYIYLVCIDIRDPCVMLHMVLWKKSLCDNLIFKIHIILWQWFCRSDFLASQIQILVTEYYARTSCIDRWIM